MSASALHITEPPVSLAAAQNMALVASSSSWTHTHHTHTPMRVLQNAAWNTLPLPYSPAAMSKPRLRLAVEERPMARRFDPFADEPPLSSPTPSTSQNTPPPRPLTLSISTPPAPPVGRRRSPSFSAGSGTPLPPRAAGGPPPLASLTSLTLASQLHHHSVSPSSYPYPSPSRYAHAHAHSAAYPSTPSPAPSLSRGALTPRSSPSAPPSSSRPDTASAPTPFHARHYPTPDARARLLARTLLTRIHPVGRPRSCASQLASRTNGYENECGGRGYVPSRLSECTMAAC
ncbi:hypothetical protein B0H12DRAFT_1145964 [Mycena haematopus]|nr:hypothetical protein B0H12DRAFT_1145964 [Mycena haematopus]